MLARMARKPVIIFFMRTLLANTWIAGSFHFSPPHLCVQPRTASHLPRPSLRSPEAIGTSTSHNFRGAIRDIDRLPYNSRGIADHDSVCCPWVPLSRAEGQKTLQAKLTGGHESSKRHAIRQVSHTKGTHSLHPTYLARGWKADCTHHQGGKCRARKTRESCISQLPAPFQKSSVLAALT
ncbi:hypothetical protein VTI74DRAFT_11549 [Chaetomium olivicolor]